MNCQLGTVLKEVNISNSDFRKQESGGGFLTSKSPAHLGVSGAVVGGGTQSLVGRRQVYHFIPSRDGRNAQLQLLMDGLDENHQEDQGLEY